MSTALSQRELKELIADSIANFLKSYEVADYCVSLGLPPPNEGEDPFHSKRVYVRTKLATLPLDKLTMIAQRVAEDLGDNVLAEQLGRGGLRGVDGELKNIIFASVGPKPRIVMTDAINNIIEVVEHRESCLIYDRSLTGPGLTWGDLTDWWRSQDTAVEPDNVERDLYRRLSKSLASPPEVTLFRTYCRRYGGELGADAPALLPQVYLHYDPYTRAERLHQVGEIKRERMDFLFLFPNRARVVLEVDGIHHYANGDGRASPSRYAEMMAEDRKIRLNGYEVYRFGAAELMRENAPNELDVFFDQLLPIHVN
jgi:hypothetical protein